MVLPFLILWRNAKRISFHRAEGPLAQALAVVGQSGALGVGQSWALGFGAGVAACTWAAELLIWSSLICARSWAAELLIWSSLICARGQKSLLVACKQHVVHAACHPKVVFQLALTLTPRKHDSTESLYFSSLFAGVVSKLGMWRIWHTKWIKTSDIAYKQLFSIHVPAVDNHLFAKLPARTCLHPSEAI